MATIDIILAENLRGWREQRGMSQDTLAKKAGLSVQAIHKIENRKVWPGVDTVRAIAQALDIEEGLLFSAAFDRPPPTVEESLTVINDFCRARLQATSNEKKLGTFVEDGLAAFHRGAQASELEKGKK